MARTITTTVHELDELTPAARERARQWYRDNVLDDWWDGVYEDFAIIAGILGLTLKEHTRRGPRGASTTDPAIWFSGFSQGDGASFEGTWCYSEGAQAALRGHAPQDEALHDIAQRLHDVQHANGCQLVARINTAGRHCHEYTMRFDVERGDPAETDPTEDAENLVVEAFRDLARWLYRHLKDDYEAHTADDAVDDAIRINDWMFGPSGTFEPGASRTEPAPDARSPSTPTASISVEIQRHFEANPAALALLAELLGAVRVDRAPALPAQPPGKLPWLVSMRLHTDGPTPQRSAVLEDLQPGDAVETAARIAAGEPITILSWSLRSDPPTGARVSGNPRPGKVGVVNVCATRSATFNKLVDVANTWLEAQPGRAT